MLALTNTGVHKLWKWQKDEKNVSGKVRFVFKAAFQSVALSFEHFSIIFSGIKCFCFCRQLPLCHHCYGNLPVV